MFSIIFLEDPAASMALQAQMKKSVDIVDIAFFIGQGDIVEATLLSFLLAFFLPIF